MGWTHGGGGYGGGIYCDGSAVVEDNIIYENRVSNEGGGGGIYYGGGGTVANNILYGNTAFYGGGMSCYGPLRIVSNTICGNAATIGGGIWLSSGVLGVTNCILWNNGANQIRDFGPTPVTFCDVQGGWSGTGNINADPLFADAPGGTVEAKFVGLSGAAPVWLLLGTGTRPSPLHTSWGDFLLSDPWILIPMPASIPSGGILEISAVLPAGAPAPNDIYMQALIGRNPDSLTNLYVVEVR